MSKKKLYHMNLVGASSIGKAGKGDKGGKRGGPKGSGKISGGKPGGKPGGGRRP